MYPIVSTGFTNLLVDALIHATVFAIMGLLMYPVLKYGKYETMTKFQKYLNFWTLAPLSTAFMTGAGYLLDWLMLEDAATVFVPTLPVKGFICFMIFTQFVLMFYGQRRQVEKIEKIEKIEEINKIEKEEKEENGSASNETKRLPEPETIDRITVKDRSKIHLIPAGEIVYIKSYGDYVHIVTANSKYIKEETMKYFEASLPKNFVRVHRSYIVNIEYLVRIESSGGRNQQIALKTGEWLNISLSGYKALKSVLNL
jgi:hypothetical protein